MTMPSPAPAPSAPAARPKKRPRFGLVVFVGVFYVFGREGLEWIAQSRFGAAGVAAVLLGGLFLYLAAALIFRSVMRAKAKAAGDLEFTPAGIQTQVAQAGFTPAFLEDGSLLGSSVLVVNQRSKLIEVKTEFVIFRSDGMPLANVVQFDMPKWQLVARVITKADQFLRYRFAITASDGSHIGYLERPPKFFLSTVKFWDAQNRSVGVLKQDNFWGKKTFTITDGTGQPIGRMVAEGLSAWDVRIFFGQQEVAHLYKNWEGWMRNFLTAADRYVMRIHQPLPPEYQQLVIMCALTVDLALKQDSRGAN